MKKLLFIILYLVTISNQAKANLYDIVKSQMFSKKRILFIPGAAVSAYVACKMFSAAGSASKGHSPSWWKPYSLNKDVAIAQQNKEQNIGEQKAINTNHIYNVLLLTAIGGLVSSISAIYCMKEALKN